MLNIKNGHHFIEKIVIEIANFTVFDHGRN